MDLTPQEREEIYLAEKAKRDAGHGKGNGLLLVGLAGIVAGLAVWLAVKHRTAGRGKHLLEDLRRAYAGLSPDEEDEYQE